MLVASCAKPTDYDTTDGYTNAAYACVDKRTGDAAARTTDGFPTVTTRRHQEEAGRAK